MPAPDQPERLYSTNAASERLLERYGVSHSPAYLRKLRTTGGGPQYVLFRGVPYYTDPLMAEYVAERITGPARSTVEHEAIGHRPRRSHNTARSLRARRDTRLEPRTSSC